MPTWCATPAITALDEEAYLNVSITALVPASA